MSQSSECCSSARTSVVMSCSGSSNVGQITNEVAKRLSLSGRAKFFCLAGIGGKVSGMVASVKGSDRTLILDGCPVACARKCMENVGLAEFDYVLLTELGIEKKPLSEMTESDIDFCLEKCLKLVGESSLRLLQNSLKEYKRDTKL